MTTACFRAEGATGSRTRPWAVAVRPLPPASTTAAESQNRPFFLSGVVAGPQKLLGLLIPVSVPPPTCGEPLCAC